MNALRPFLAALAAMSLSIVLTGCSDRDPTGLPVATGDTNPVVFDDDFAPDVYFQPFFQTNVAAVSRDSVYAYGGFAFDGARSMKVNVAPAGSAMGIYSGGVLTSSGARDLAGYNALTFYARASQPINLDIVGFGNDNTGTSLYEAGRGNLALGADWTFVVVPIPAPGKLRGERGMFTFAEGLQAAFPAGYDIWFDEIRFARLGNISVFRPSMPPGNRTNFIGSTVNITGTRTVFLVDGAYVVVDHSPGWFDYHSSDESVAVAEDGRVRVVGAGQATITATVQDTTVLGAVNVTGYEPPTGAAADPTLPASQVISMFSDSYVDVPVDTWRASWGGSTAQVSDYVVAGNTTKMYGTLNFVGIEFTTRLIDASAMTHFHLDVYAPAGSNFKVKLVSFPTEGAGVQTGDLILTADSTPAFAPGGWSSLEIPLTDFVTPEGFDWGYLGQLVLSTNDAQLVLVDNVYFHQ